MRRPRTHTVDACDFDVRHTWTHTTHDPLTRLMAWWASHNCALFMYGHCTATENVCTLWLYTRNAVVGFTAYLNIINRETRKKNTHKTERRKTRQDNYNHQLTSKKRTKKRRVRASECLENELKNMMGKLIRTKIMRSDVDCCCRCRRYLVVAVVIYFAGE